ncbi:MAG: spondin domain-containing protein [Phormidesmis sp.]
MMSNSFPSNVLAASAAIATTLLVSATSAVATEVTVTIDNLAPDQGLVLTPLWVGFHDGSFDLYDPGAPASAGLESISEDGRPMALSEAFNTDSEVATSEVADSEAADGEDASDTARQDGVITGVGLSPDAPPLIPPGTSATMTFTLQEGQQYFSYASMVLPSNDGFIGNESGTAHRLFDAEGNFIGTELIIIGSHVQDAGTEVNDEAPENVPLLGQASPNTGTAEGGTVARHTGFAADGNVLQAFPGADLSQDLYPIARIRVVAAEDTADEVPAAE